MKRKFIYPIFLIILLLIVGCDNNTTTTLTSTNSQDITTTYSIDTQAPTTTLTAYNYVIRKNNVENFYDLSVDFSEVDGSPELNLNIDLKEDLTVANLNLQVKVYYTYFKDYLQVLKYTTFSVENNIINEDLSMNLSFLGSVDNFQLYYIEVLEARGAVVSKNSLNVTEKTYLVPPFQPQSYQLVVEDPQVSEDLFDDLVDKFESLDLLEESSFTYGIQTETKVKSDFGTETTDESIQYKFDLEELYFEQRVLNDTYVIKFESDRFFLYPILEESHYDGKYYVNPEVIEDIFSYLAIDVDDTSTLDYILNPEKVNIRDTENGYSVIGYLIDMVPLYDYLLLEQVYMSLGISQATIQKIIVQQDYIFSEKGYEISTLMQIPIYINYIQTISIKTVETFNYQTFTKVDLTNEELYVVYQADHINEVTETTDLSTSVESEFRPYPAHYYYAYLEAGQYKIMDEEGSLKFDIYSTEEELLDTKLLNKISYSDGYIFIDEPGYYYLEVKGRTSAAYDGYLFFLEKLDYETIYCDVNQDPLTEGNLTLNIEGENDYIGLTYEASEPTLLKISASEAGQQLAIFYNHPSISGYATYYVQDNMTAYIEMEAGTHELIFASGIAGEKNILVEKIDISAHKSDVYSEMTEMSDEFVGDYVFASDILGDSYFKLVITEQVFISFRFQNFGTLHHPSVIILDEDFNSITYSSFYTENQGIKLEAGNYILQVASNMAAGGEIHYVLETYEDQHYEIELQEYSSIQPFATDFPKIESRHLDNNIYNYYWFNLTEEELIYISGAKVEIFTENDERVTVLSKADTYYGDYVKLNPGRYYMKVHHTVNTGLWTYTVKIAIITSTISDDNYHGSLFTTITPGIEQHTFNKDNQYDQEWLKLVIEVSGTYSFRANRNTFVYDEEGNFIRNFFDYESFELEAGIYYIQLPEYGSSNTWIISVN
jgi:hypothetical protein